MNPKAALPLLAVVSIVVVTGGVMMLNKPDSIEQNQLKSQENSNSELKDQQESQAKETLAKSNKSVIKESKLAKVEPKKTSLDPVSTESKRKFEPNSNSKTPRDLRSKALAEMEAIEAKRTPSYELKMQHFSDPNESVKARAMHIQSLAVEAQTKDLDKRQKIREFLIQTLKTSPEAEIRHEALYGLRLMKYPHVDQLEKQFGVNQ